MPPSASPNRARAAIRRTNQALLRSFLRVAPQERHRLFFLTVLIGAVCGLTAVLFHLAIRLVERNLIDRALSAPDYWWIPWTVATPALGALAAGLLLHFVVPSARGSGIPQVKLVYAVKSGRLRLRDTLGKFVISALQIGTGSSLGREGPTVYICAGTASALGRLFAISNVSLRRLLPVGAAAGIAAAFNAPIAAVTFTIEEIVGDLDQTVLSGVVVAAALAAVIERSVLGEHPVFDVPHDYGLDHPSSLIVFALLGVVAALVSHGFSESLLGMRSRFTASTLPPWAKPALGGLVTGALAAVAFGIVRTHGITGGGYVELGEALNGRLAAEVMILLCVLKTGATVSSYASGGSGGIFAPVLFIGGMLGGAVGMLDQIGLGHADADLGAFALVGMGAVFAGVIRAPITSVLIIFEMTGSYRLVLPLMIANTTAYVLARRLKPTPIYEALLEQDGHRLPHRRQEDSSLSLLRVGDAMTAEVVTLPADLDVRTALDRIKPAGYSAYPVIGSDGRLVGVISEARLRRRLAQGDADGRVGDQLPEREHLRPDQSLLDAVLRMNQLSVHQMVVIDAVDPHRLVGLLAMSDAMRAQARFEGRADPHPRPTQPGERDSLEPRDSKPGSPPS